LFRFLIGSRFQFLKQYHGYNVDIRWLQDFLTVAEIGNFTRAAESRNASQAAFSRRIQSLEAWLGTTLIDRGVFPTRLTPHGERFKEYAGAILRGVMDARSELSGKATQDHVRIAVPYAIATSSLPAWWSNWSRDRNLACSIVVGNVHDMMTALVSGGVDILICFHTAQQPIQLDPTRYERLDLHIESIRPYASRKLVEAGHATLPGRPEKPLPLLMYSPDVYFARMIELIIDAAPQKLIGERILDSDMSDVLREMAIKGFGVAWLPDCTVEASHNHDLVAIDDGITGNRAWSLDISTVAIRSHTNERPAVRRLWSRLKDNKQPA
jgi:LysR family transcriptional regulator, hypochlorite-specific transcription factor HypT